MDKVIISCAVTGSLHTPSMSEYLPVTPDEIATSSIEAVNAGAAILHLHARDPIDGRPSSDPDVFLQFLPAIRDATDAVMNVTTGGGQNMSVDQRLEAALRVSPELASLNMGSMNFGLFPALNRYKGFKHNWEQAYLEDSKDFIFKNTFKDIEYILEALGKEHGTKFEFECYDLSHLYTLAHFLDRKLVQPPLFVQTIFGVLGGMGPDLANLAHIKQIADGLFGDEYVWSVMAAGRHQMPFATSGALSGSHVRVGLEDSLFAGRGKLAVSNAEQVALIKATLAALSLKIATPDEARQLLALKGAANVGF